MSPTPDDRRRAEELSRQLASHPRPGREVRLQIALRDGSEVPLPLPDQVVEFLSEVLAEMAGGRAVALIPIQAELTTQEAADFLNVSRPFLIGLLERGEIPHRRVGTHRRISSRELFAYKERGDRDREEALGRLVDLGQETGVGYLP